MPAHRPTEISHIGIHVTSLERSLRFYRDRLGLEVVGEWLVDDDFARAMVGYPTAKLKVALLRLPGSSAYLEIIAFQEVDGRPVDPEPANPGTAHISFYVDDLDAVHKRLATAGTKSVTPAVLAFPAGFPMEGGKVVYVIDPDGIRVELLEAGVYLDGSRR
jgi:catechol 2,3-dioxygenase-like lactoylglutathione lyase family enzyme